MHSNDSDRVTTALTPDSGVDVAAPAQLDVSAAVGTALRQAREASGLSMRALARLADISQPFLSQVERGTTSPSLFTLYRIAHALGIAPTELMPGAPVSRGIQVLRGGEGSRLPVSEEPGSASGRLLSTGAELGLEVVEYRVQPDQDLGGWFESSGEQTLYVADGELEVTLEGHGTWQLGAGDAISHPSDIRHRWRAMGLVESRVLLSVVHAPRGAARDR